MRIGLFGGTFNPIHNGHLYCVRETAAAFSLDQVHLIPAAVPPHKVQGDIAPARHRLAMVRLAAQDLDNLRVTDLELTRTGPSYTVDTIRHYREKGSPDEAHFLIMGMDSLLEIHTWKSFDQIFARIPLIVMFRPDVLVSKGADPLKAIHDYLKAQIDPAYGRKSGQPIFRHPCLKHVYYMAVQARTISATEIRRRVRRGQSLKGLVPPAVSDYIDSQGLYQ